MQKTGSHLAEANLELPIELWMTLNSCLYLLIAGVYRMHHKTQLIQCQTLWLLGRHGD